AKNRHHPAEAGAATDRIRRDVAEQVRRLLILPDAREQGCKQYAIRDELRGEFMGTSDHGYDHLDRVGEPSHVEGHPEEGFMLCRFATREFAAHLEGRLAIPDAPEA